MGDLKVKGNTPGLIKYGDKEVILMKYGSETIYEPGGNDDGPFYFKSCSPFTMGLYTTPASWDGTLEYSFDNNTYTVWDGSSLTAVKSGAGYYIYLRGTSNTVISGSGGNGFKFTGDGPIEAYGNIDILLDYQTVNNGEVPTLGSSAFRSLFYEETSLVRAPKLGNHEIITEYAYRSMFLGTGITVAPDITASIIQKEACDAMFRRCYSLVQGGKIENLVDIFESGCRNMYYDCTALKDISLIIRVTDKTSFAFMFVNCTSLVKPNILIQPLPAYNSGGTSALQNMFEGCSALEYVPAIPWPKLNVYCLANCFKNCTSLYISDSPVPGVAEKVWRIPTTGTFTSSISSQTDVFLNCLGTRGSNNITASSGQYKEYYTQHDPIS